MKSDDELLKELEQATSGLLMMSESDYPFEVVNLGADKPTHEFLKQRAGKSNQTAIETKDIDDFFRNSVSEPGWKNEAQLATARQFQNVVKLLKEELSETLVYRIGEIDITVFIVGKSPHGSWLGLSTRVIET